MYKNDNTNFCHLLVFIVLAIISCANRCVIKITEYQKKDANVAILLNPVNSTPFEVYKHIKLKLSISFDKESNKKFTWLIKQQHGAGKVTNDNGIVNKNTISFDQ